MWPEDLELPANIDDDGTLQDVLDTVNDDIRDIGPMMSSHGGVFNHDDDQLVNSAIQTFIDTIPGCEMHNGMVLERNCKIDAFKTLKEALVNFCYDEVNREHYQVVVETCFPKSYDESQKC